MKTLRALIVDDEPLARDRLRALLGSEATIEIIGECGSGTEAIAKIRAMKPDLVFLDVQMPGCDGLAVIKEFSSEERPAIIFVTAHDRFALDAFEVQAVDYLLKPFDRDRLQVALRRAQDLIKARRSGELEEKLESLLAEVGSAGKKNERLAVKADGRVIFLRPEDVVWVEAADNYVLLHLASSQLIVRETMAAIEERFGKRDFARVNRSALVHLDQIRELQPTFHGDYVVILRDGTKLPLSRTLRGQLEKLTGDRLG